MEKSQFNEKFAHRLRQARNTARLSQADLASSLGMASHAQISRYESGKSVPDIETAARLAECLNVDLHWLVSGRANLAAQNITGEWAWLIKILIRYAEGYSALLYENAETLRQWVERNEKSGAASSEKGQSVKREYEAARELYEATVKDLAVGHRLLADLACRPDSPLLPDSSLKE